METRTLTRTASGAGSGSASRAAPAGETVWFDEVQWTPAWVQWLPIGFSVAIVIVLTVILLAAGSARPRSSVSGAVVGIGTVAVLGAAVPGVFVARLRLRIEVRGERVRATLWPVWRTTVPMSRIDRFEVVDHARGSANVGLHWVPGQGWVYSMGAKRGVRIVLRSGTRLVLMTPRAEELLGAMYDAARAAAGEREAVG